MWWWIIIVCIALVCMILIPWIATIIAGDEDMRNEYHGHLWFEDYKDDD